MSLDDACQLVLAGLKDGARVSGKECSLNVDDVADLLDDDFDALIEFWRCSLVSSS